MSVPQRATAESPKWVYSFGLDSAEGSAEMRELLGGKGANLAEMSNLGLPVPPGFTITTDVCTAYYENGGELPDALIPQVEAALDVIGKATGRTFDDGERPLSFDSQNRAKINYGRLGKFLLFWYSCLTSDFIT